MKDDALDEFLKKIILTNRGKEALARTMIDPLIPKAMKCPHGVYPKSRCEEDECAVREVVES